MKKILGAIAILMATLSIFWIVSLQVRPVIEPKTSQSADNQKAEALAQAYFDEKHCTIDSINEVYMAKYWLENKRPGNYRVYTEKLACLLFKNFDDICNRDNLLLPSKKILYIVINRLAGNKCTADIRPWRMYNKYIKLGIGKELLSTIDIWENCY